MGVTYRSGVPLHRQAAADACEPWYVAEPKDGFRHVPSRFCLFLLFSPAVAVAGADAGPFAITVLRFRLRHVGQEITSGRLDGEFRTFDYRATRQRGGPFWLRLVPRVGIDLPADVALAARKGRHLSLRAYDSNARAGQPLTTAAALPEYRGEHTALYALPAGPPPANPIYVHADVGG